MLIFYSFLRPVPPTASPSSCLLLPSLPPSLLRLLSLLSIISPVLMPFLQHNTIHSHHHHFCCCFFPVTFPVLYFLRRCMSAGGPCWPCFGIPYKLRTPCFLPPPPPPASQGRIASSSKVQTWHVVRRVCVENPTERGDERRKRGTTGPPTHLGHCDVNQRNYGG